MPKKYDKLLVVVILILMYSLGAYTLFKEKKQFSENENRVLTTKVAFSIKDLLDGKYTSNLETMLSDQFAFRDDFMNIKTNYDKLIGKRKINDVFIAKNNYLIQEYKKPQNTSLIINSLNRFYESIFDIDLDLMLVPTSITINENLLPIFAPVNDQLETIKTIYDGIEFNTIDIYNTLTQNNQNYQLYYRLDHHWTTFGAYFAYLDYCINNNITPLNFDEFNIEKVTSTFRGTLFSRVINYFSKPDDIYLFHVDNQDITVNYIDKTTNSLYNLEYLNKKDKYALFLDGNHPLIVIENNNIDNNEQLIVIKDSYANAFIPFLVNHYQKIHVIDPRFYQTGISDYIMDNNITKGLILYNINTIDNDLQIRGLGR